LCDWYDRFEGRPPLVLVHGEPEAQATLQGVIRDKYAAAVHIAQPGDRFDLFKPVPFDV